MPPEFFYPAGADFWTPAATLLALTSEDKSATALEQTFNSVGAFHVLARLKPGVSLSQAEMDATRLWKTRSPGTSTRIAVRPLVLFLNTSWSGHPATRARSSRRPQQCW
jgi:hypothetical protein